LNFLLDTSVQMLKCYCSLASSTKYVFLLQVFSLLIELD